MTTELFYSHILDTNRGSLHTTSFRLYTHYSSLLLDTDELKLALRARKVFGAFEKRALPEKIVEIPEKIRSYVLNCDQEAERNPVTIKLFDKKNSTLTKN